MDTVREQAAIDLEVFKQLKDPACPPGLLVAYADHPDGRYRQQVTRHPGCPADAWRVLVRNLIDPSNPDLDAVHSEQDFVYPRAVTNLHCPLDVLLLLVEHGDETIQKAAYAHSNMPEHLRTVGALR